MSDSFASAARAAFSAGRRAGASVRRAMRLGIQAAGCVAASVAVSIAFAQPVTRVVVPAPVGGGTDVFFRLVGKEAEPFLKNPVIVANVGGAGGQCPA
jgi:tripartite-type tricarboxylate transporter receptor subunit TctC